MTQLLDGERRRREGMVSIVLPVYNEGVNIDLVHTALGTAMADSRHGLEMVFVDDGSTDDSLARLEQLARSDPRVVVVELAHNVGHQAAITAGLDMAAGDAVVVMDSDLQDPPEVVPRLVERWEQGCEVVYAQRRSRRDTLPKRLTASLYYRLLSAVSSVDIPRDTGDFRLMDRRVVDEVRKYREHDRYLRGIVASLGFRQGAVDFDRDERRHGTSHYTLPRMLGLAWDGLVGFSSLPLLLIAATAMVVTITAALGLVWLVVAAVLGAVPAWAPVTVVLLALSAAQLGCLAIVASYLGRVFHETRDRPLYAVRSVHGSRAGRSPEGLVTQHSCWLPGRESALPLAA